MNPYHLDEKNRTEPIGYLPDGTSLYPAYEPHPLPGERFRRPLSQWHGSTGLWVGTTLDGRLYRQRQMWGGDEPEPEKWERVTLGYDYIKEKTDE